MHEFTTPMMKQYQHIKKQYQDCLLLYRMGDFYELFMEDAHIGAQVLNITLTSRPKGKDGRIPMAGVPYHAVDSYIAKLVRAGYKVAICEQLTPPNKRGIVERDVVRIVTPGTVLDEKALDKKDNNYIISLAISDHTIAISASDLSTGFFSTLERPFEQLEPILRDELSRLNPVECILSEELYSNPEILKILKSEKGLNIYSFKEFDQFAKEAPQFLKKHFKLKTLASFGIDDTPLAMETAAALLGYLRHTQKGTVEHIKKITLVPQDAYMQLDKATILNLELFSTIREHDTRGSLLTVLDQTITAMGGRMLKQWLKKPLIHKETITNRHDAVEEFLHDVQNRLAIREILTEITDIERVLSRLSVNIGNARDLITLKLSLQKILALKAMLGGYKTSLVNDLSQALSPKIKDIIMLIETSIVDEPPVTIREGGMIQEGIDKELDTLRSRVKNSKVWIENLEKKEKEKTGIGSLKVRFNKVFGFYIEISKTNLHLVPKNYQRKQTLVNGERYMTESLKVHEEIILTAEEKINTLEYKIFCEVLQKVLKNIVVLQEAAQSIAALDCLLNFAFIAEKNQYVRPKLLYSGEIRIKEGRHPVVEKLLEDTQFVPNDITLDTVSQQLLLITGPNMAGKSVLIRQVALLVLLSQIGSFVPAKQAYISVVDRVFVRSGASDVITSGLSTFMVEMVETAHILHYATKNSLIIMDEIGRGTSTYDGISIAWAVAEYLVTNLATPPKTLFATHYHELQALEEQYPKKIKNFHMAVTEQQNAPIFLYTLFPGGASHSFGVAVAKLAGIPESVIQKATEMLHSLENRQKETQGEHYSSSERAGRTSREVQGDNSSRLARTILIPQTSTQLVARLIQKELENIDISQITPLEALNMLARLKEKLKMLHLQEKQFAEVD